MFASDNSREIAYRLTIKGLVQGVGFRPFLYRLANQLKIKGWTKNTNHAVIAHIQGVAGDVESFIRLLKEQKPPASVIDEIKKQYVDLEQIDNFNIGLSEIVSSEVTNVSPDIAVCNDCIDDLKFHPRRIMYPLVNCCNCGPRFSIVQTVPYDRINTTMQYFEMCDNCRAEYNNPFDRRFHAQPIACNDCGPKYTLHTTAAEITDIQEIINFIKIKLGKGGIFAFKGTGGFHLVCDANNESAASKLRKIKHRDTKPFAVMFGSIDVLKKYAVVNSTEEKELVSFRRPIVIVDEVKSLSPSVSMGFKTIGGMLPYMPFHHILFEHISCEALVMTSGNFSDEPIIIDNKKAIETFLKSTDGVLTYNRDIYNRIDDPVLAVVNDFPRLIRRSRGYVPGNIKLPVKTEGIFASGAELTGTFCIGKGNNAIPSQYFGDLQNFDNLNFYIESYDRFSEMFRFEPDLVVADLHPDYNSTRFAQKLEINIEYVQHHHAHIASVIAEHNIQEPVIGVSFDGTGLGTDGNIWGSEFLICHNTEFERYSHFDYIPLPGGDKAVLEPWRCGLSYLKQVFGNDFINLGIPFTINLDKTKTNLLFEAIDKGINIPLSCGAGRLFDAVAAVSGICSNPRFHAEAPMRLESYVNYDIKEHYNFEVKDGIIFTHQMWKELVDDLLNKKSANLISSKFHNTIVQIIINQCINIKKERGINSVALSGGTFQNKFLLKKCENILINNLFQVYTNREVPSNDAGISLGQLYLAAKRRELCV